MEVVVLNNQSFLDIAIQHTGSVVNAFKIALANNRAVSDTIASGSVLTIPESIEIDVDIRDYFNSKGIKPATAASKEMLERYGIGVMKVGKTFKVG